MPTVVGIFTCPNNGRPMKPLDAISAVAGKGLGDDRYAEGRGAYSHTKPEKVRHVTLIAAEDIERANEGRSNEERFLPADTRRNIVTRGVYLLGLIGKEFQVGEVRMRGVEDCTPCERPSKLCGKEGFAKAFEGKGGLRAEVLSTGLIMKGAEIILPD